jgi:hypothetical protein
LLEDNKSYISNSFTLSKFEIPFEIRWRGSNQKKYKFWRLYTGITTSYVVNTSSNFLTREVDVKYRKIKIVNPWQFGLNLALGYGTWNFNFYYGLSDIIKDDIEVENTSFKMKDMRFGVAFYFL